MKSRSCHEFGCCDGRERNFEGRLHDNFQMINLRAEIRKLDVNHSVGATASALHGIQQGFTLIAIIATVKGVLIQMIMASRVRYGLADRGLLPPTLAYVSPRTQRAVAIGSFPRPDDGACSGGHHKRAVVWNGPALGTGSVWRGRFAKHRYRPCLIPVSTQTKFFRSVCSGPLRQRDRR